MTATPPYEKFKPEPEGEAAVAVNLTMRECIHILSAIPVGHTWDGYSTGVSVLKKLTAGMNHLEVIGDDQMVSKMMSRSVETGKE
ncbi:MAG TPA: hypothetical protein VGN15_04780 [Ktedonobacteraceae bacterium]|jgi:hypothetical protein|nr:hypothetical protein [Ktedonobacteraceae bacterium]